MYAVVEAKGRQYRVSPGDQIVVDRMDADEGSEVVLDRVLLVSGSAVTVGAPVVEGAAVTARVLSHDQGDKAITYKYARRKRFRKRRGFRASLTTLEILGIRGVGGETSEAQE